MHVTRMRRPLNRLRHLAGKWARFGNPRVSLLGVSLPVFGAGECHLVGTSAANATGFGSSMISRFRFIIGPSYDNYKEGS